MTEAYFYKTNSHSKVNLLYCIYIQFFWLGLMQRKIIHCDADCFFAAIEMRDDPRLRDLPMAVGGSASRRGVISTCNYVARKYGVHSAMSSAHAMRLCPNLVIIPGNMEKYCEASKVMRSIFYEFTELVEPLSLDEAYLDVSQSSACAGSATLIAEKIRQRIFDELKITVSAGVAPNKFIAKIASDWNKPNGLCVVTPEKVEEFVKPLPVRKIHGVGRVTANKLKGLGIETCEDIRSKSLVELSKHFGAYGLTLSRLALGEDTRLVTPDCERKSLSVEHTYSEDLSSEDSCMAQLPNLLVQLRKRVENLDQSYAIAKAFVKVKFNDFSSTTLERVGTSARISDYRLMMQEALKRKAQPVRLLGIGVRFSQSRANAQQQLALF